MGLAGGMGIAEVALTGLVVPALGSVIGIGLLGGVLLGALGDHGTTGRNFPTIERPEMDAVVDLLPDGSEATECPRALSSPLTLAVPFGWTCCVTLCEVFLSHFDCCCSLPRHRGKSRWAKHAPHL